jgi:hypothetical protein
MGRNILLIEPGYKTKFPPLGLMKISTYHKKLGDKVKFVKGKNDAASYEYWDRIYVSTVFTYNWNVSVDTIKYYKALARGDTSRIYVGGILATLMAEALWNETGVIPKKGVLNYKGALNDNNDLIVDNMIPDYELFDNSPYDYSLVKDSYFGYSTRGCVNSCDFCGVPMLEPDFVEYTGIKPYIDGIRKRYGEKCNLVLFDNNILYSKKFEQIIKDLLDLGFEKGSKIGYKNKANQMTYKSRCVDFNQGIDARLMKEWKVKLIAEIALKPMRIAFDHIKFAELYSKKIALAAKYGIVNLSNYILYNWDDTPEHLWERLKINIDLNKKYGLKIYSFPMKYIPLKDKNRSYINSPNWNWQYIRGVQRILNVLKGTVMTSEDFFYRAFGETPKEFLTILNMPEKILMNRTKVPLKDEIEWRSKFNNLTSNEKEELLNILCENRKKIELRKAIHRTKNQKLKLVLDYYLEPKPEDQNLKLFE